MTIPTPMSQEHFFGAEMNPEVNPASAVETFDNVRCQHTNQRERNGNRGNFPGPEIPQVTKHPEHWVLAALREQR